MHGPAGPSEPRGTAAFHEGSPTPTPSARPTVSGGTATATPKPTATSAPSGAQHHNGRKGSQGSVPSKALPAPSHVHATVQPAPTKTPRPRRTKTSHEHSKGHDVSGGSHDKGGTATPTPTPGRHSKAPATPLPTVRPTPTAPPMALHFAGSPRKLGDLFGLGSYVAQRTSGLQVQALNDARSTGVTWLREEFTANQIHSQTSGPYRWARYDRRCDANVAWAFTSLACLTTATRSPGQTMRTCHMVSILISCPRFRGVRICHGKTLPRQHPHVAGVSEPDLHLFWRPYPNASDYAIVLNQAYAAIKRANPKAQVVLGGPRRC